MALSVTIASNYPGYDKKVIYNTNPDELINQMFNYIKKLVSKINVYTINKFKDLLNDYDKYANNKREFSNIQDNAYQVPIIGFSSGKYDNYMALKNHLIF